MRQFQKISVFLLAFLSATVSLSAQDLLYKKDATILNVKILSFQDNAVMYSIPGDTTMKTWQISTEVLDSIISSEGKVIWRRIPETYTPEEIKRNYLGIDLMESFVSWFYDFSIGPNDLHFSYERISKSGKTSFSAEYLVKVKDYNVNYAWDGGWFIWDNMYLSYESFNYFIKAGINKYPFNYSLAKKGNFRLFTGISVFYGRITKFSILDQSPYEEYRRVSIGGLIWNLDTRYYLANWFQLKAGIDISVIPLAVFISPEIGISIAF